MKKSSQLLLALVALALVSIAQSAHAVPVGTLTCSTSTDELKFNVSYFTFGLLNQDSIGSSSSGAGAGKVTFQPLEVHAALSTFGSLVSTASDGTHLESCSLTTRLADGTRATFLFKLLAIQSLTVVASSTGNRTEPAQYTDIKFLYGAVQVTGAGGTDDGGSTVLPPGWNQVTNTPN